MAAERPNYERDASEELVDIISSGSTDVEEGGLEKVDTRKTNRSQRSARDREFAPIRNGDREELQRIASSMHRSNTSYSLAGDDLERKDTLADVNIGDAVLDPTKPEFDSYKWARMYVRTIVALKNTDGH